MTAPITRGGDPSRLEEVYAAADAIEESMKGETRWNATTVADRLLDRGFVIRRVSTRHGREVQP